MADAADDTNVPQLRRVKIGAHETWEIAPGVIRLKLVGIIDGPELEEILRTQRAWGAGFKRWYSVTDLSGLTGSTRSARTVMSKQKAETNVVAIQYGATFAVRMLTEMTLRARKLLTVPVEETYILQTEAEAMALLEKLRQNEAKARV